MISRRALSALASLLLTAASVSADSLDEIIKSPSMRAVTSKTSELRNHTRRIIMEKRGRYKVSSNHDKLFTTGSERESYLLQWACASLVAYQTFRDRTLIDREFIDSRRIYHLGTNRSVMVRFIVPHPNYLPMAELGLIKELNDLFPPKLTFEYAEDVPVRKTIMSLYRKKDGSCSIPMRLTKQSALEVSTPDCQDLKHVLTIFESLNLDRIDKKLNS